MAIPQVMLPVPFEQIPAEVKRLADHARQLEQEREIVFQLIKAVRSGCNHSNAEHWTDRGGGDAGRCPHCGLAW